MKKRIYFTGLVIALSLAVVGCGKNKDKNNTESTTEITASDTNAATGEYDEVKTDLLTFVNEELPKIESKKNIALEIYNSNFDTENINVDEYAEKLDKEAVPAMKEYIDELTAISVKTEEVETLKQYLLESAKKQQKALKQVSRAISEPNRTYLKKADKNILKAKELTDTYKEEMTKLAKNCGINVIGNETGGKSASGSDADK